MKTGMAPVAHSYSMHEWLSPSACETTDSSKGLPLRSQARSSLSDLACLLGMDSELPSADKRQGRAVRRRAPRTKHALSVDATRSQSR